LHVSHFFTVVLYGFTLSIANIVVNEVADKGTDGVRCEGAPYIEVKYIGRGSTFNPSSHYLYVTGPNRSQGRYAFPHQTWTVDADRLLVVCKGTNPNSEFQFDIGPTDTVRITGRYAWSHTTGPLPGFGSLTATYQRRVDGTFQYAAPTPYEENAFQAEEVVINEVADTGAAGSVCDGEDYIELKNIGPNQANLNGFALSLSDVANPFTIGTDTIIDPYAFLVLCKGVRGSFTFDIGASDTVSLTYPGENGASTMVQLPGDGSPTATYQRLEDGSQSDFRYAEPTPNAENAFQEEGTSDASAQGDPHFKTWRGQRYDFHGECDLVLLQSKDFMSGLDLDVHIRTKMQRDMSYISSAALRIGSDVLEVESQGVYYLNGVVSAELPGEFSGFEFLHTQPTDKQHVFEVHLGWRERIKIKTYKDYVSVLIEQGQNQHFGDSVGLMGDFETGRMIARDGKTVLDDENAFGQEWQVLHTEPTLFQAVRFPRHPQECTMPTLKATSMLRRRLLESSSVDELAAEKACEHWGEGKDDCVFDVLTTGDVEMAVVGAY
jgi:hypothetical protein